MEHKSAFIRGKEGHPEIKNSYLISKEKRYGKAHKKKNRRKAPSND